MLYHADTNTLELSTHTCYCKDGTMSGYSRCLVCNGSGLGKRGKRGGCKNCYGRGRAVDHSVRVPCAHCNGTQEVPDDWCSNIPQEARDFLAENVTTIRVDRHNTWNEEYLGVGTLWSSTDYGQAWNTPDEDTRERVATELLKHSTQAIKVVKDTNENVAAMSRGIVIEIRKNGYSVLADWR